LKLWLNILTLFVIAGNFAFTQGFDWQYHSRLPYKIPNKFIGLQGGISQNTVVGEFGFAEDYIKCCNYESGKGNSIAFSVIGEYWLQGNLSIAGSIGIISTSSSFSKSVQVPRSNGVQDWIAVYRYDMNEVRNYLEISPQVKYRLGWKYLSATAKLSSLFLLSNASEHSEMIKSPDFEYFIDGSKKREIIDAVAPDYHIFIIEPYLGLSYDQPIALSYYASINVGSTIPIMSAVSKQNYREWKASISISVYRALIR
jgi:hypothetical protein